MKKISCKMLVLVTVLTLCYVSCEIPAWRLDNPENSEATTNVYLEDSETLLLDQREHFIYPITGYVSRSFGWQLEPVTNRYLTFHRGIDLPAGIDTPVKAAMAGVVVATGSSQTYGNYIIIGHGNSYHTFYAHLSAVSINKGDHVMQGNIIGKVGDTGYSTGPHLHFGIYRDGIAINPLDLLE